MDSRTRYRVFLVIATIAAVLTAHVSTIAQATSEAWAAVAPTGRLRVGVYPGSPTSMIRGQAAGDEKGLTVDLGREFARRLGIPAELVEFPQIAGVLEALTRGTVDFTVTNATPARATVMDFSRPIAGVELVIWFLHVRRFRHWLTLIAQGSAWASRPGVRRKPRSRSSSRTRLWCRRRRCKLPRDVGRRPNRHIRNKQGHSVSDVRSGSGLSRSRRPMGR